MTRGSVYDEANGTAGIRWPEDGKERRQGGFRNPTAARNWFDENVAPRLRRGLPSGEVTFEDFCLDYLARYDQEERSKDTLKEWLVPAREKFGTWKLRELEGAADDISRWRSKFPTEHQRYKYTRALRQVLAAAKRWRYMDRNPAVDFGKNTLPRSEEVDPFTPAEMEAILAELADEPRYKAPDGRVYRASSRDVAIVLFASETGLRTGEWCGLERRDIDRHGSLPVVSVARSFASGKLTHYPKTSRSNRAVPLTPTAIEAVELLAPRLDSKVLFPNRWGDYPDLNNWRGKVWTPALKAAGVRLRGPYHLRHTFATEALRQRVPVFDLAKVMGTSSDMIDVRYGAMNREGLEQVRAQLANRSRGLAGAEENG
jgi:integrase